MTMDARRKRTVLLVSGAGALVLVLAWFLVARMGGGLRQVSGESAEMAEAMRVIEVIALDPARVPDYMASDASGIAVRMVTDVAKRLPGPESLKPKSAAWWGGYLRITVSWPRPEGEPLERTFFLKREGGELRITGLQT